MLQSIYALYIILRNKKSAFLYKICLIVAFEKDRLKRGKRKKGKKYIYTPKQLFSKFIFSKKATKIDKIFTID